MLFELHACVARRPVRCLEGARRTTPRTCGGETDAADDAAKMLCTTRKDCACAPLTRCRDDVALGSLPACAAFVESHVLRACLRLRLCSQLLVR